VLLSNTNDLHFRFIRERYPLLRHFDAFVLSYEVKAAKPDPRIYAAAIEAAGCAPHECFFTDDVEAYVDGARRAGIHAEQFTGYENLKGHLAGLGVRAE
jgi:putative hydrolase of the HAD superfamily